MNVKNVFAVPRRTRKMYCITICCIISVTYAVIAKWRVNIYHVCEFVEYVLTVVVYLLHKEEQENTLCSILDGTDIYLQHKKFKYNHHVKTTTLSGFLFMVLKLSYLGIIFNYYMNIIRIEQLEIAMVVFLVLSNDLNNLTRFMYFDILKFKMKSLHRFLGIKFSRKVFCVSEQESEIVKSTPTLRFLNMYRDLLDEANKMQDIFNFLIFVSLSIAFPKSLICMYNFLQDRNSAHFTENIFILLCNIFFILVMRCIPGIAAEQTAGEVDKIKLLLLERSVQNIGDREENEARLFLRYLDLRPFRVRVWRTFAIDAHLPLTLISLYTTYLIVLVQLTHLYD